jgi:hypothetical protein
MPIHPPPPSASASQTGHRQQAGRQQAYLQSLQPPHAWNLAFAAIVLYGPAILNTDVPENPGAPGLRQPELPHAYDCGPFASARHAARRKRVGQIHAAAFDLLRASRREGGRLHLPPGYRPGELGEIYLFDAEAHNPRTNPEFFQDDPRMQEFLTMASHGQVMLSMFRENFPSLPDGTVLLLDEPEMALSVSNQRRILKMLLELVDQKKFRVICATHSPVLIDAPETYTINLDNHINKNVLATDLGVQGASTIQ